MLPHKSNFSKIMRFLSLNRKKSSKMLSHQSATSRSAFHPSYCTIRTKRHHSLLLRVSQLLRQSRFRTTSQSTHQRSRSWKNQRSPQVLLILKGLALFLRRHLSLQLLLLLEMNASLSYVASKIRVMVQLVLFKATTSQALATRRLTSRHNFRKPARPNSTRPSGAS